MPFHNKNKPLCTSWPWQQGCLGLLWAHFFLASVGSANMYMLQMAANCGSDSLSFDVKAGAKCGGLFKLDRVEFVCTFELLTPLLPHRFYQPSPSPALPTQTWIHFSTKSCIKDTQHHRGMRTAIRHSEERNMWITEQIKMLNCNLWGFFLFSFWITCFSCLKLVLYDFCLPFCKNSKHKIRLLSWFHTKKKQKFQKSI